MNYLKIAPLLLLACSVPCASWAQETPAPTEEPEVQVNPRPKETDKASRQLIQNFLAVTGGKQAHINLRNIVAKGTIEEAGKTKKFELIKTQDGKRKLTFSWRLLGREYVEVTSFDGVNAWTQKLSPKEFPAKPYGGRDAQHFINQRWFIQPLVVPLKAAYDFKYQGADKVGGRPAHVVVGYGKKDERTWFYFDKETFLLTRWGGLGTIAGVEEYLDYRATRFAKVNGVLLPKQIDLLVEGSAFGTITFDSITPKVDLDTKIFYTPIDKTPVLRQRPVAQ
ncbi:MAG: hypothetical protein NWT02_10725 [Opitutales bacterium]|jgi:hypothetical protein|nr:hypothetical protein [Opitutales bacterium]MDP4643685.1 hypothetical protein [Opitutales bacterium]